MFPLKFDVALTCFETCWPCSKSWLGKSRPKHIVISDGELASNTHSIDKISAANVDAVTLGPSSQLHVGPFSIEAHPLCPYHVVQASRYFDFGLFLFTTSELMLLDDIPQKNDLVNFTKRLLATDPVNTNLIRGLRYLGVVGTLEAQSLHCYKADREDLKWQYERCARPPPPESLLMPYRPSGLAFSRQQTPSELLYCVPVRWSALSIYIFDPQLEAAQVIFHYVHGATRV